MMLSVLSLGSFFISLMIELYVVFFEISRFKDNTRTREFPNEYLTNAPICSLVKSISNLF